jgi:uncharacterized protein DUF3604
MTRLPLALLTLILVASTPGCTEEAAAPKGGNVPPGGGPVDGAEGTVTLAIAPARMSVKEAVEITFTLDPAGTPLAKGGGVRFELPIARRETSLYWNRPQTENAAVAGHVRVLDPDLGCRVRVTKDGVVLLTAGADGLAEPVKLLYRGRASGLAGTTLLFAEQRVSAAAPWTPLTAPPTVEIAPGPAEVITVTAPADVVAGEQFTVALVALDHFGNATVPPGPVRITTGDGTPLSLLPADAAGYTLSEPVVLDGTGFQRFHVETEGVLIKTQPVYVHPAGSTPSRRFFGDLQFHTGSGAGNQGFRGRIHAGDHRGQYSTNEQAYRYARDTSRLDFAATTEHSSAPLTEALWNAGKSVSARLNEPRRFTTFFGYEWTSREHGHRCVIHRDDAASVVHEPSFPTPQGLRDELTKRGVDALVIPHLMTPRPDHRMWQGDVGRFQRVGEIFSQKNHPSKRRPAGKDIDGVRILTAPADAQLFELGVENRWSYQHAWANGHRLGVLGSSDTHYPQPGLNDWTAGVAHPSGLAVVLAEENTRDAIWGALHARRCYATTGARIYLDVTVADTPMGGDVSTQGGVEIHVRAAGTRALDRVEIVRGTAGVYTVEHTARIDGDVAEFRWEDASAPGDDSLYYVRVFEQARPWGGAEMAWSSPVWVKRTP